jgi:perosamine synthetase
MSENKLIPWWRTYMGQEELSRLSDSYNNEKMSYGSVSKDLEKLISETLDVPYVMMTTSGSISLYLAVLALGIGEGDEVLIPDRTFHATAHAAMMTGATVRLVETLKDIPAMDPVDLEKKITDKTKAIMVVHLNGRASDMRAINLTAKKHNLKVIEDVAQSLFSKTEDGFLGTQSDVGCFSMGMTKLVSTGQGGFVVTKNKELYEHFLRYISHGVENTMDGTYKKIGFNFRFNDLLASIGIEQFKRIPEKVENCTKVYKKYLEAFETEILYLKMIPVKVDKGEVPIWVEALIDGDRQQFMDYLKENGVEARRFLPSLNLSEYVNTSNDNNFENSMNFDENGLFLPAGPSMSLESVDRVIELLKFYKA